MWLRGIVRRGCWQWGGDDADEDDDSAAAELDDANCGAGAELIAGARGPWPKLPLLSTSTMCGDQAHVHVHLPINTWKNKGYST